MNVRYREVRLEKGLTLEKAAGFLGKSKQWLSEVERGNIALSYEDSVVLAKAYDGTPDIFFHKKSKKIRQNPRHDKIQPTQHKGRINGQLAALIEALKQKCFTWKLFPGNRL